MKKIVNIIIGISATLILSFLVYHLISSYSLLFDTFYSLWSDKVSKLKVIIISTGFALSSLFIIFFYKTKNYKITLIIKILFVILDVFLLSLMFDETIKNFTQIANYVFACYTGLILYFIGSMVSNFIKDLQEKDKTKNLADLENTITDLQKTNEDLKRQLDDFESLRKIAMEKIVSELNMRKGKPSDNEEKNRLFENYGTAYKFVDNKYILNQ